MTKENVNTPYDDAFRTSVFTVSGKYAGSIRGLRRYYGRRQNRGPLGGAHRWYDFYTDAA